MDTSVYKSKVKQIPVLYQFIRKCSYNNNSTRLTSPPLSYLLVGMPFCLYLPQPLLGGKQKGKHFYRPVSILDFFNKQSDVMDVSYPIDLKFYRQFYLSAKN